MANLKIAVIGAGSFVFGPAVLQEVFLDHKLAGVELALMDVSRELVELTAAAGNRIAADLGVNSRCTAHTTRDTALDGADFVVCAAARDMRRRFANDRAIALQHDPDSLITEFGGIVGISYSLRQIALFEEICADIRRFCPRAFLLNSANPLPRVCLAAHQLGVHTVGFCSVGYVGLQCAWRALKNETVHYPFTAPRTAFESTAAGVNHLSFLLRLKDRASGTDLLPELRRRAAAIGQPRTAGILARTGYLITSGDEHSQDFLPSDAHSHSLTETSHGSDSDRSERLALLKGIADRSRPYEPLFERQSWEKPISLIVALSNSTPTRFEALNLVNSGQIPALPAGAFVETPAHVSSAGIVPERIHLPAEITAFCRPTAELTTLIVRAGLQHSRPLAHAALDLDPTIVHHAPAHTALDALLTANADILPAY